MQSLSKILKKKNIKDLFLGEVIINIQETKKLSKYQEMFRSVEIDINGGTINKGAISKGKVNEATSNRVVISNKTISGEIYLFYFLLIHGLLHLIGYNDETEKERFIMLKLGRDFLKKML